MPTGKNLRAEGSNRITVGNLTVHSHTEIQLAGVGEISNKKFGNPF